MTLGRQLTLEVTDMTLGGQTGDIRVDRQVTLGDEGMTSGWKASHRPVRRSFQKSDFGSYLFNSCHHYLLLILKD